MGNCLVHESSSMHWGGDDWGSPADEDDDSDHQPFFSTKRRRIHDEPPIQEKGSFGNNSTPTTSPSSSSSSRTTTMEVKIKVTRRELERLLGKVDMKELSVQDVVKQLMIVGENEVHDESTWRPALNSIPE